MSWDRLTQSITPLPTWQQNHEAFMRLGEFFLIDFAEMQFSCPVHNMWEPAGRCKKWAFVRSSSGEIEIHVYTSALQLVVAYQLPLPAEYIWRYRGKDGTWHYTLDA